MLAVSAGPDADADEHQPVGVQPAAPGQRVDEGERQRARRRRRPPSCVVRPPRPRVITATAPTPAPAVMPSMPGSASGLRQVACTRQPASASAAPAQRRGQHPRSALVERERDQRPARPRRAPEGEVARPQPGVARQQPEQHGADQDATLTQHDPHEPSPARGPRPGPRAAAGSVRSRGPAGQDDQHDGAQQGGDHAGRDRQRRARRRARRASRRRRRGPRQGADQAGGRDQDARAGAARGRPAPSSRATTGAHSPTKPIGPGQRDGGRGQEHGEQRRPTRGCGVRARPAPPRCRRRGRAGRAGGRAAARRRWPARSPAPAARTRAGRAGSASRCPRRTARWSLLEQDEQRRGGRAERHRGGRARQDQPGRGRARPAGQREHQPAAARPPTNATSARGPQRYVDPERRRDGTAKYAPAFTASVSGEASGLRATDWNSAPATPRAKPTASPAASRGSREPTRMSRSARSTRRRRQQGRAGRRAPTPEYPGSGAGRRAAPSTARQTPDRAPATPDAAPPAGRRPRRR